MRVRCLAVMLTIVLLAVACSGDDEPQPQATIRFAAFGWTKTEIYDDLMATFEEENPGLHVEFVPLEETLGIDPRGTTPMPDDAAQRLVQAADVLHWLFSRDMVGLGLLRDLAPFMDDNAGFQADDYFPGMLQSGEWQGGIWALPALADMGVILYDRQAFDQAGVSYPQPGWIWDDFRATVNAVTMREGDEVTRWGFVGSWPEPRIFAEGLAGPLLDGSTDPPTPRFDDPQVVEAVRRYAQLVLYDRVVPYFGPRDGTRQPEAEEQALIGQGRAAMWFGTSGYAQTMAIDGRDVGTVPFPADSPDAAANPLWTQWSLMMSAGTAQPEAAWRWIAFLSRQNLYREGMVKFYPPRRSVFEAAGFWDEMDAERAATLRYALEHSFPLVLMSPEYEPFDAAIDAILGGEQSVEQALSAAQALAETRVRAMAGGRVGATPAPTLAVVAPSGPTSETAVTITFSPRPAAYDLALYRELATRFQREQPGIAVEVRLVAGGEGPPSLAGLAAGADCFQWFPTLTEAADRAAILSLEPFLGAEVLFPTEDYWPGVWEPFVREGEVWGLPADVTLLVVEYNRDLFDAAGVASPAMDWTWDDFAARAAALTEGEGEARRYGFAAGTDDLVELVLLAERLGARLLAGGSDAPAFTLDDPATAEAVRRYAEFVASYGIQDEDSQMLIDADRVAMWTRSTAERALRAEGQDVSVGVAPLPSGPGGSYVEISGYFVSARAEHPQACWQWIAFLSGQPEIAWGLPARRSVAESERFRQRVGGERADAYLASVTLADRPSIFQTFSAEEWLYPGLIWYGRACDQVLGGETTVEQALAAAQALADSYRACVLAGDGHLQGTWRACARQTDPTLPGLLTGDVGE
jgi:multiple sugar transport system substrate-binding protein